MILISKFRMSASKKISLVALIRTLTISTTTFERMKEKFYGFRQPEYSYPSQSPRMPPNDSLLGVPRLSGYLSGDSLYQSAKNRRKECYRFWLRLRHIVILIIIILSFLNCD